MEWYEVLIQQTINGLTRGAVFALIALGYTMVYGIIELINFAHGDVFMLGLFISLAFFDAHRHDAHPPRLAARHDPAARLPRDHAGHRAHQRDASTDSPTARSATPGGSRP